MNHAALRAAGLPRVRSRGKIRACALPYLLPSPGLAPSSAWVQKRVLITGQRFFLPAPHAGWPSDLPAAINRFSGS